MTYRVVPPFACITCGGVMGEETVFDRPILRCERCRAVWIERAELAGLLRAELVEHNDGSPRRPCPVCAVEMNIVWLEFLSFEQCDVHGVWLDEHELERAMRGEHTPADLPKWVKAKRK